MALTPKGLWYPAGTDIINPLHPVLAAMQTSVDDNPRLDTPAGIHRVANSAGLTTLLSQLTAVGYAVSAANPVYAHRSDDGNLYVNTGSGWNLVHTNTVWQSYTPAISGFTLGNGTVTGQWVETRKTVTVEVFITLGTTSVVSDLYIPLPKTANRGQRIGTGWVSPSGPSGAAFTAFAFTRVHPDQVLVRCPDSSQSFQPLSPTFPAAWSAGGQVFTQITYGVT